MRSNALRFKRRSDLVNFAQKHPGALAAMFVNQVRAKLGSSAASSSAELLATDLNVYASNPLLHDLKEVRDQKEVAMLCRLLVDLSHDKLPQVADIISQRIREIRLAKRAESSWDKAAAISLLGSSVASSQLMPDAAFTL